jgi:RNA recognition motif-containing protein
MTKLFVGSLPFSTTSDQLGQLFSQFGEVATAAVIMDKFTGRSRGFGFVEMPNDEEAQKAISELNNSQLEGRNIVVSVAKPKEERPSHDGFRRNDDRRGGGGFNRDNRNRR